MGIWRVILSCPSLYNAYKAQTSAATSSLAQSKRAYPSDQGGHTIDITSDEFMTVNHYGL